MLFTCVLALIAAGGGNVRVVFMVSSSYGRVNAHSGTGLPTGRREIALEGIRLIRRLINAPDFLRSCAGCVTGED
ncbi:hypothetical protein M1N84_01595 [Dehalococcoidia bacterium]|nr:hypothetical protein [Dehalococcoidia bacterium]